MYEITIQFLFWSFMFIRKSCMFICKIFIFYSKIYICIYSQRFCVNLWNNNFFTYKYELKGLLYFMYILICIFSILTCFNWDFGLFFLLLHEHVCVIFDNVFQNLQVLIDSCVFFSYAKCLFLDIVIPKTHQAMQTNRILTVNH